MIWAARSPFAVTDYPSEKRLSVASLSFQYKDLLSGFFPPVELALGIPSLIGSVLFLSLLARAYFLVRKDRAEDKNEFHH